MQYFTENICFVFTVLISGSVDYNTTVIYMAGNTESTGYMTWK